MQKLARTDMMVLASFCISINLLFPDNRCDDFSTAASLSELTEIDALPSTEVQSAIGDGDGERNTYHRRLGMG